MVDPAHDGGGAGRGGGGGQRCAVGHRLARDEVSMATPIIFCDVTFGYERHPAVHHLSGEVAAGALLAVVGPNGAGKSTLFRGIVGILKPLSGAIDLGGLDIRDIAYLPQSVDLDRSFPISVFDFVGTGLWRAIGFFGGMGRRERDLVTQALAAVGLNGFENRKIGTLSGGQMQRMLFARLLLQDARVIVLDEPFNAIDAKTSADLLVLVKRWQEEGRTVLAALHDFDIVRANFPETLLLARGPVAWGPTAQVLTTENLAEARRMCEAFDDTAAACAIDARPSQAA
jgi:zinc/manganese transport system ATP-binding protein